jgi:hypothetical protein
MHKWLSRLILAMWLAFPISASSAQSETHLSKVQVQLWPEYDQPSMLVIYDFEVDPDISLPARVDIRIPATANLIAVASLQNGGLVNAEFEGPVVKGETKAFAIIVKEPTSYHFEYYQPLVRNGVLREFDYLWPGDHAVDEFTIRVQQPLDTTLFSTDPLLIPSQDTIDGLTYYVSQPMKLNAGSQYALDVNYEKTSDALTMPATGIQSAAPLDENTLGRISASDYMPYVIAVAIALIAAGSLGYYYMSERIQRFNPRKNPRASADEVTRPGVHCHQCGQRARSGDRFCRICGTHLRAGS